MSQKLGECFKEEEVDCFESPECWRKKDEDRAVTTGFGKMRPCDFDKSSARRAGRWKYTQKWL